ncbi:MAG: signal peptidase I [Candidatus Zixiibacteriota bacterium]
MTEFQSDAVATIGKTRMMKRRARYRVKEYVEAILIALVIASILRVFVVQAYRVESGSMEDTMETGDFVFVNKFIYHFRNPVPGDVIVFEYPLNPSRDFIKRVVAVEGQIVEIKSKQLFVDGQPVPDPVGAKHIDSRIIPSELSTRDHFGPKQVPPGQYFVMGDNRDDSRDSRFWGFVDLSKIKGKSMIVYFSWKDDPNAPEWSSPYIDKIVTIPFYNLINFPSRVGWSRLFKTF